LTVNRLIRLSFGPFMLGDLKNGAAEEVKQRVLADQLEQDVAKQLGLKVKKGGEQGKQPSSRIKARPKQNHRKRKIR
jgi:23S rRNA pseudouridine2605 synthase